jgi:hypothetical protein
MVPCEIYRADATISSGERLKSIPRAVPGAVVYEDQLIIIAEKPGAYGRNAYI